MKRYFKDNGIGLFLKSPMLLLRCCQLLNIVRHIDFHSVRDQVTCSTLAPCKLLSQHFYLIRNLIAVIKRAYYSIYQVILMYGKKSGPLNPFLCFFVLFILEIFSFQFGKKQKRHNYKTCHAHYPHNTKKKQSTQHSVSN